MPKRKKRTITAEDLYRFELITGFRLSPDGENVIYAVQRVDKKTEKKFSNLWIAPTGRGAPRQFTYGDHTDAAPRWSPDGKTIAFISNRHNEREPQIYLIPVDGGEARKLTDMKGTIADFKWSPDSSKFLVTFIKKDKEAIERESDEQKKKLGVVQRHITRVFYKFDGAGYLPKERAHLWIVSASNGKAVQITKGDVHDEADANWSPDGKTIIFVSNRSDDPDLNIYESQLYTVSAKGGRIKELKTMDGDKMAPKYSPDGKWIAFLGQEGRGQWWKNGRLWIVPSDGKGKAICLTRDYDFDVSHWTINDIIGAVEFVRPCWTNDCKHIHFQVAMHGNTVLKKINVEGKKHVATDVITGDGVVGSYGFDDKQEKFAYYYGTMTDPGQIHFKNLKRNTSKTLTRMNSWLNRVDLGECEEVWFKGAA
ncbi:MAG TPA: DPP IV N-terminal domain-containing protein, partial [bacterium]